MLMIVSNKSPVANAAPSGGRDAPQATGSHSDKRARYVLSRQGTLPFFNTTGGLTPHRLPARSVCLIRDHKGIQTLSIDFNTLRVYAYA